MRYIFFLLGLGFSFPISSQDMGMVDDVEARHFRVVDDVDTVQFLVVDGQVDQRKPVFIMLQGSLPIPLITDYESGAYLNSFPYDITELKEAYHVVNISMPHVPLRLKAAELNPNGMISPIPPQYNKANYLDNYVNRTNSVIDYLVKQKWVDASQIVLFGHSQGSSIAVKVANGNPHITHLGLAGFNPFGRYEGQIRVIRAKEMSGAVNGEEAQARIDDYYARWGHYAINRDDDTQLSGDTYKATFSFSEYLMDDLLNIDIPIYITYGSKDIGALGCDYIPIEMERSRKSNYTMKVYPGMGHNFEKIKADGTPDYDVMKWDEVMGAFVGWVKGR